MDYGRLLARSWQHIWQVKHLWFYGLLASLGQVFGSLPGIWLNEFIFRQQGNLENLALRLQRRLANFDWTAVNWTLWLLGGTLALVVLTIALWLIAALAEGALIGAVQEREKGNQLSWRQAAGNGWRLLGRFIAIDTLVFLPLFLLTLLVMGLLMGAMLVGIVMAANAADPGIAVALLALAPFCLLPFLLLMLPVGVATAIFRTLAFRETAARPGRVRLSLRRTWRTIQRHWGTVLILTILLWAIASLIRFSISMASLPFYAVAVSPALAGGWLPASSGRWLITLVSLGLSVLTVAVSGVAHAFTATVWTLAYGDMQVVEG